AKRRTTALLAADLDAAARLLDEPEHHAEPEPGALADFLCREEGIENPVANGLRDTGAGIGNLDDDVVAGALDADGDGLANAERDVSRRQCQLAAARHRIAGVDGEVEQR